jgi:hypothetical protein
MLVAEDAPRHDGGSANAEKASRLWASVSVSHPVIDWGLMRPEEFTMQFAVVNDGAEAINPDVDRAELFVNGKAVDEVRFIVEVRDWRWKSLPPKQYITFKRNNARYFKEPGTYRLTWRGQRFESPEVIFRVVPPTQQK